MTDGTPEKRAKLSLYESPLPNAKDVQFCRELQLSIAAKTDNDSEFATPSKYGSAFKERCSTRNTTPFSNKVRELLSAGSEC